MKESSRLYSVWAQEVQYLMQNLHKGEYWTGPTKLGRTEREGG